MKRKLLLGMILVLLLVGLTTGILGTLFPTVTLTLSEKQTLSDIGISDPQLIAKGCDDKLCQFVIVDKGIKSTLQIPTYECAEEDNEENCLNITKIYTDGEIETIVQTKLTERLTGIAEVTEKRKIAKTQRFSDGDIILQTSKS